MNLFSVSGTLLAVFIAQSSERFSAGGVVGVGAVVWGGQGSANEPNST